jgi:hypothetical protein
MKFTLNRDLVHASTLGHCVEFKKGEPTFVPEPLHREVLAMGAEPESELDLPETGNPNEPKDAGERYKAIVAAFEALTLRNNRDDFDAGGKPKLQPLREQLGFGVDAKERDKAWERMRAAA